MHQLLYQYQLLHQYSLHYTDNRVSKHSILVCIYDTKVPTLKNPFSYNWPLYTPATDDMLTC